MSFERCSTSCLVFCSHSGIKNKSKNVSVTIEAGLFSEYTNSTKGGTDVQVQNLSLPDLPKQETTTVH